MCTPTGAVDCGFCERSTDMHLTIDGCDSTKGKNKYKVDFVGMNQVRLNTASWLGRVVIKVGFSDQATVTRIMPVGGDGCTLVDEHFKLV